MSVKNLVICDSELSYANALAENIAEREELSVKVYTFTSVEKASLFLGNKKVDILLLDESFAKEVEMFEKAEIIFWLVHGEEKSQDPRGRPIFKYQCATHIIQEVFETYVNETKKNIFKGYGKSKTKLEAVYSPVRGIGKTRFAITYGKERAKKEKVLYLNMEEYPGFEVNGPDETKMNLGDLLYFTKQKEGNLGLRLQSAVQKMGELDYIPPIYLSTDLKDVKDNEWTDFLKCIVDFGFYDLILLDLGECVQGLLWLLQLCDHIFMPTVEHEVARQKILRFEECLERLKLEKLLRVIQQFEMPDNVEEFVKIRIREAD